MDTLSDDVSSMCDLTPIRDAVLAKFSGLALAIWTLLFSMLVLTVGNRLTSKPWQYLMTVPGGKWFWVVVFGIAGVLSMMCIVNAYRAAAFGFFLMGCGSLAVAVIFISAPATDAGAFTLGWFPWGVWTGVAFFGAVVNWKPISWF